MTKLADRLEYTTQRLADGRDLVVLTGAVNEHAPDVLARLAVQLGARVTIDLGGLSRINSLGVRAWIDFVDALRPREVSLRRCVPLFVEQLNTLATFRGTARIETVLAPYLCNGCGRRNREELAFGVDLPTEGPVVTVPLRACPGCGHPMELDDFVERYFGFVGEM